MKKGTQVRCVVTGVTGSIEAIINEIALIKTDGGKIKVLVENLEKISDVIRLDDFKVVVENTFESTAFRTMINEEIASKYHSTTYLLIEKFLNLVIYQILNNESID